MVVMISDDGDIRGMRVLDVHGLPPLLVHAPATIHISSCSMCINHHIVDDLAALMKVV